MTTSNQVIIKVRSDAHQLSVDKFWLGFVIWHRKNETNLPSVSAVEIAGLGLSINNLQKGGFAFPVDIRNKYRMTPELMFQYLLEIDNLDEAFELFKPIDKIDFIFASKNSSSIAQQQGLACVDFISVDGEKSLSVNEQLARYSAVAWHFATGDGRKVILDIQTEGQPVIEWHGDIESYLAMLQDKFNSSTVKALPSSSTDMPLVLNESQEVLILNKGDRKPLSQLENNIDNITVGLGWNIAPNGEQVELDASVFLLNENGIVNGDHDLIYYHQLSSSCESVCLELYPDSGVGQDKAKVVIDLNKLAPNICRIVVCLSIYDADTKRQSFNQVLSPYFRICNSSNDKELARFNLPESHEEVTAMIFGEVYRYKNEWKVNAVGQGFLGGLPTMCQKFGIEIQ